MRKAASFFTEEQKRRIERAVADAESKTSVEIVPVVATASGRYDRPEDIVGIWVAAICMAVVWHFLPKDSTDPGAWGFTWTAWRLPILIAVMVLGFIGGAVLAGWVGWLRRLFTPRREQLEEVSSRAHAVFFDNRVHQTKGGTGLLLYLSLFERTASVVADDKVIKKLGQAAIEKLCHELTKRLRAEKDPAEALASVIAEAGQLLGEALPAQDENPNELSDSLILLD